MTKIRASASILILLLVSGLSVRVAAQGASPAELVKTIVDADVAGEALVRSNSKLRRLPDVQKLDAVTLLIEGTRSAIQRSRINCVQSLGMLDSSAVAATGRLVEMLGDAHESQQVRALVAATLARVGGDANVAVPALTSAMDDPDRAVREQATLALVAFAPGDLAPAIVKIVALLKDREMRVRIVAAKVAGHAGAGCAADVIPPLMDLLSDGELQVRTQAIESIGQLHEGGAPAVQRLTTLLHESDRPVLRAAAMALARIGEPASTSLGSMQQAGDRTDLRAAIALLKYNMGQTAVALADLKDAAAKANSDWLTAIDEIGAPAVPMLAQLLESRRTAPIAIEALQKLGPSAKDALSELRRLQSSTFDKNLSSQAQAAIQLIDR